MKSFLLEIGTEEIPARFIAKGLEILKTEFEKFLNDSHIDFGKISQYATPRRLTLLIHDVAEKQKNRIVKAMGPPRKVAYDKSGNPTSAALGFAKSLNIDVSRLETVKTDRGEYLSATVEEKGLLSLEVLAGAVPGLLSSLQLPKSMKWGDSAISFFRPIHWITALFGAKVIPFELDGIKSGNISFGHRFLSPAAITINRPENYLRELSRNHAIADIDERRRMIEEGISKFESDRGCRVHKDRDLLDTVTNLVEFPTVVAGSFNDKYLELPKELPITVMRSHQKYFSTEDKDGKLLPYFIVVSNTKPDNNETVRIGAERVLRARLEDASFYYTEDRKKPLADYVEELKNVTFQEKLGSLFDKTGRITSLCSFIADRLNLESRDSILKASKLAKADLVTGVVGEFPELQGYMGMIYAANSGENSEVASAIHEHYLPKFAGDDLPSSATGTVVSIADKIDNIASFFFIGLIPSGSEDPFALRRQAAGTINMLKSWDYSLSLNLLIDNALKALEDSEDKRKFLTGQIIQFFNQRLEGILLAQGYSHDLINAVLSSEEIDIKDLMIRIAVLSELKRNTAFPGLLMAAKRVCNILSGTGALELKESMMNEQTEKDLCSAVRSVSSKLSSNNFEALFDLETPINNFFDGVMVMDKDTAIRDTRLALLQSVKKVFDSLGDFSKILED